MFPALDSESVYPGVRVCQGCMVSQCVTRKPLPQERCVCSLWLAFSAACPWPHSSLLALALPEDWLVSVAFPVAH